MVDLTADARQPAVPESIFRVSPHTVATSLWAASAAVIFAGLFREWYVTVFGIETIARDLRHLAFNAELCLPAWYTSLLLAFSAVLIAFSAFSGKRCHRSHSLHWLPLIPVFVGLSIDEATGFHEVLIEPLRSGLGLGGFLYFSWVIPGAILVGLFGLFYLPFLFALPARSRVMFMISGLLYVGGALGMEVVGGKVLTIYGETSLPYQIAFCVEEIMEILGATLFAASLLGHLKRRFGGVTLVLS